MTAPKEYLTSIAFEPSMAVQNAVTCAAVLILFAKPGRDRNHRLMLALEFIVLFTALVAMNGVWEGLFHRPGSYFATHLLLMAGYILRLGKLKKRQYIITIILFYAVETAGIVLSSIIPEILMPDAYGALETVLRNLVVLSTLAAAVFSRQKGILSFQNLNAVSTVYALLIGSATALLAMAYSDSRSRYDASAAQFALLAFSCILVIDLVAYYMNYAVAYAQEREKRLVIENYMARNDRELLRLNQQNLEDMRKIRHDIKNHFAYLEVLLREGRPGEALDYFEELRADVLPQLAYIDCGNRTVSAILNLETAKSRAQGIALDYRCMVEPELPVRDSDLCALMTNLIDNAKLIEMFSNGNWQEVADPDNGVPRTVDLDGPAGLTAQALGTQDCQQYQHNILIGSTWNTEMAALMGTSIANEIMACGWTGWYGPGTNIHRSEFCGRNTEYMDPTAALYSGGTDLCLSQVKLGDTDNDLALKNLQTAAKNVLYNKATAMPSSSTASPPGPPSPTAPPPGGWA